MIRPGIGSWTLPWAMGFKKNTLSYRRMNVFELLDFARSQNISLVQLYNNVALLSFTKEELRAIRSYADQYGIELAVGGDGIEPEYVDKLIRVAVILGSKTVRVVIPPKGEDERLDIKEAAARLSESVNSIESRSLVLLIENHDRYTSMEYREIIEGIASPSVGICFDTANSAGKLEHFRRSFSILKDYILNCHYKEYIIRRVPTNLGFILEGYRPGHKESIADEFFSLLKGLNRDIDVTLEQWVPYQGAVEDTLRIEMEWALAGIRILKDYANKIERNE